MTYDINLHKLTIPEIAHLKRECEEYLAIWFAFSQGRVKDRTPEWVQAAKWRLEGSTEDCCKCGQPYPSADLHFDNEVYCEKCRKTDPKSRPDTTATNQPSSTESEQSKSAHTGP